MAYNYTPSQMWTMARNDNDSITRSTNHPRKITMTIFWNIKGIAFLVILPEKAKSSFKYFREDIVNELDLIMYPTGQKSHTTCMCRHLDNVLSTIPE
jgi:hypothetical protein